MKLFKRKVKTATATPIASDDLLARAEAKLRAIRNTCTDIRCSCGI